MQSNYLKNDFCPKTIPMHDYQFCLFAYFCIYFWPESGYNIKTIDKSAVNFTYLGEIMQSLRLDYTKFKKSEFNCVSNMWHYDTGSDAK